MELLADENIETEWVQALHDVVRVVDVEKLGVSATDRTFSRGQPSGIESS